MAKIRKLVAPTPECARRMAMAMHPGARVNVLNVEEADLIEVREFLDELRKRSKEQKKQPRNHSRASGFEKNPRLMAEQWNDGKPKTDA